MSERSLPASMTGSQVCCSSFSIIHPVCQTSLLYKMGTFCFIPFCLMQLAKLSGWQKSNRQCHHVCHLCGLLLRYPSPTVLWGAWLTSTPSITIGILRQ